MKELRLGETCPECGSTAQPSRLPDETYTREVVDPVTGKLGKKEIRVWREPHGEISSWVWI